MLSVLSNQAIVLLLMFVPMVFSGVGLFFSLRKKIALFAISLGYFITAILATILFFRLRNGYHHIHILNYDFFVNRYNLLFIISGFSVKILLMLSFHHELEEMDQRKLQVFLLLGVMSMCFFVGLVFSKGIVMMVLFYFLIIMANYFSMDSFHEKNKEYDVLFKYLKSNLLPLVFMLVPSTLMLAFNAKTTLFKWGGFIVLGDNSLLISFLLAMFIFGISMSLPLGFSDWILEIKKYSRFKTISIQTIFVNASIVMVSNVVNCFIGVENLHKLMDSFASGGWMIYFFSFHGLFFSVKAMNSHGIIEKTSFSTMSQTGYTVAALLLGTKAAFMNVVLWMFFHSFAKAGLLLMGHVAYVFYNKDEKRQSLSVLSRNGFIIPYTAMGFSIAGVPPLAGFFSKYIVFLESWRQGFFVPALIVFLSAVINVVYIWPGLKGVIAMKKTKIKTSFFGVKHFPLSYSIPVWVCFFVIASLSASFAFRFFLSF